MRDIWTEEDVIRLAFEESNNFDRKSGRLLEKEFNQFLNDLSKALSAFANSGGGSIILGVEDDGEMTGVDERRGATSIKDWLEQKIPSLLCYQLSLFRVHTVIPSIKSTIPKDKVIIVIEVGDSPAAPHQSNRDKKYYHRSAGRSEPASHFYLELLRQRLTNPILEFKFRDFKIIHSQDYRNGIFVESILQLEVINVGNVAAYKWEARVTQIEAEMESDLIEHVFVHRHSFPLKRPIGIGVPIDKTILPGLNCTDDIHLGFFLPETLADGFKIDEAVLSIVRPLIVKIKLATETSRGEITEIN